MKDLRRGRFLAPAPQEGSLPAAWRVRLHEIIFEADTPAGRFFDLALIVTILLSVVAVMLDSIVAVQEAYGHWLLAAEWFFTILFTIEYLLRLVCIGRPLKYATSFFGVIDLLSILPTYLSLLLPGSRYLLAVRILRVLRIFRIMKLGPYISEADSLVRSLKASRRKIAIFLYTVLTLVVILGSVMYLIEGGENGFTSIPTSIYWAIVTLTTVGYGDISPNTVAGQISCLDDHDPRLQHHRRADRDCHRGDDPPQAAGHNPGLSRMFRRRARSRRPVLQILRGRTIALVSSRTRLHDGAAGRRPIPSRPETQRAAIMAARCVSSPAVQTNSRRRTSKCNTLPASGWLASRCTVVSPRATTCASKAAPLAALISRKLPIASR